MEIMDDGRQSPRAESGAAARSAAGAARGARNRLRARTAAAAVCGAILAFAGSAVPTAHAGVVSGGPRLSEIRVDQSGADTDEYFEIVGASRASLSGWWFLAVGDSASDSGGVVEMAVNLSQYALGNNGYFVGHEASFGTAVFQERTLSVDPQGAHATIGSGDSLNFENSDNVTYMLVRTFTGSTGMDLDTNNDGVFDATPWAELGDSVAFMSTASTDLVYSQTHLGPVTLAGTGGMPPHGWWNGAQWEAGAYASWEFDTPGSGPAVPGPGAAAIGSLAGLMGGGYHRPRRRR